LKGNRGPIQEAARLLVLLEQVAHLVAQLFVTGTGSFEEGVPLVGGELDRRDEDFSDSLRCGIHGFPFYGAS
jgi:hypothetical protein